MVFWGTFTVNKRQNIYKLHWGFKLDSKISIITSLLVLFILIIGCGRNQNVPNDPDKDSNVSNELNSRIENNEEIDLNSESSIPLALENTTNHNDIVVRKTIEKFLKERHSKSPHPIHSDAVIAHGKAAVPYVIPLLNHEDSFIRYTIPGILAEIGDERAVPALFEAMIDNDQLQNMPEVCNRALLKFGLASVPHFIKIAKINDLNLNRFGHSSLRALKKEKFPKIYKRNETDPQILKWFENWWKNAEKK